MVDKNLLWSHVKKTPENVRFAQGVESSIRAFKQEEKNLTNPFGFTVQKRKVSSQSRQTASAMYPTMQESGKKFDDMTVPEKLVTLVLNDYRREVVENDETKIVHSAIQKKTLCFLTPEYMDLYRNLVENNPRQPVLKPRKLEL